MKEVQVIDKQLYLTENYPFGESPLLTDKKRCIHCEREFTVGDFKVYADESGEEYICCPYTPDCNGTVIDWMEIE